MAEATWLGVCGIPESKSDPTLTVDMHLFFAYLGALEAADPDECLRIYESMTNELRAEVSAKEALESGTVKIWLARPTDPDVT